MRTEVLTGRDISAVLPALAGLRIEVFRDWPYLYEGSLSYEEEYLSIYTEAEGAIVVAAYDGDRLVGASTGCPLSQHSDSFGDALSATHLTVDDIFYCAESVLLPEFRGRGLGHEFFDRREEHGRKLGLTVSAFAGIVRPQDHPLKPADYRSLDRFWRGRGYAPLDGAVATFNWKDVGQPQETEHALQFWCKPL